MQVEFNWAMIRTPQLYEDLIGALLSFEYLDFTMYTKVGRDAGIDGQSNGGKSKWQFKFHSIPSTGQTIKDTRNELQMITSRLESDHQGNRLWEGCEEWTLVTNLDFNPQSEEVWNKMFQQSFSNLGIKARLWGNNKVEPLLIKHVQVADYFFEGKNRCFLSLDEARTEDGIVRFGKLELSTNLMGRDKEMEKIVRFLHSEESMLLIHGAGAVGKSRILLEAGHRAKDLNFLPLWANVSTMAHSEAWLKAFQTYDRSLLLIDEPTDPDLINTLAEQFRGGSRLKHWKFIIATGSPKDPILEAARSSIVTRSELVLNALSLSDACEVANKLLNQTFLKDRTVDEKSLFAEKIAKAANGFPGWMVLAIETIEGGQGLGDLPTSQEGLAARYVAEILKQDQTSHVPNSSLLLILRWIALFQRFDIDNAVLLDFLRSKASLSSLGQVEDCIRSLTARKVLAVRGVKKQYRMVKPDVIRDHLLKVWLIDSSGDQPRPTATATNLIKGLLQGEEQDSKPLPEMPQILKALAELDLRESLMGRSVNLLGPIFDELESEVAKGDSSHQKNILSVLKNFACARAEKTISICGAIRKNPREKANVQSSFGTNSVSHQDVIDEIPWLLFETARYIEEESEQKSLLYELCELLKIEYNAAGKQKHNEPKSAAALIPRIIGNKSEVIQNYENVGYILATEKLSELENHQPSLADLEVAEVLSNHFLSVEREDTVQVGSKIIMRRSFIGVDSQAWRFRETLLSRLRLLATTAPDVNIRLWVIHLIEEATRHASRALNESQQDRGKFAVFRSAVEFSLGSELQWIYDTVSQGDLLFQELAAYRSIWSWYAEYGSAGTLHDLAKRCEEVYARHPMVVVYGTILERFKYEEAAAAARAKAEELAKTATAQQITEFVRGAEAYLKIKTHDGNLGAVASILGEYWISSGEIRKFCFNALHPRNSTFEIDVGMWILLPELKRLRNLKDEDGVRVLLDQIFIIGIVPEQKARMVLHLYIRAYPNFTGPLSDIDCSVMEGAIKDKSIPLSWYERFSLCSILVIVRCERGLDAAAHLWDSVPIDKRLECLNGFTDNTATILSFARHDRSLMPQAATFEWMIEKLLEIPDLDQMKEYLWHNYTELAKVFPKRSLKWLKEAIELRINASKDTSVDWKPLSRSHRLSLFCESLNLSLAADCNIQNETSELLELARRPGLVGYLLPKYAVSIDPQGLLIPAMLAERIRNTDISNEDLLHCWIRFSGYYGFGSSSWRTIAEAAFDKIDALPTSVRGRYYAGLLDASTKFFSYNHGQMNPGPGDALSARKAELEAERDPNFIPFRKWFLQVSQVEFDQELAEFQEEQADALD